MAPTLSSWVGETTPVSGEDRDGRILWAEATLREV
jgi:hypothetical protein